MVINLRDIFLKMIPYMLSIAGGLALYLLTADNIKNPNLADLINNIAASLLAIPLVFLLYDYSNYRVSRQLKKTLADNMGDKINVLLMNLIIVIRQIIGLRGKLTFTSLNKMGDLRVSYITSHLKITSSAMNELRACYDGLDNLIYHSANSNVLSADQVQSLSALMRQILQLLNEHKFRRNRRVAAKYIKNIIVHITDWLDSDALAAMHFQQLLGAAQINEKNQTATSSHSDVSHSKSWFRL